MSTTSVPELYGSLVFSDKVMRERLPKDIYKAVHKTIQNGSHLELDVPYFDLDKQDMSEFYRYHTENGQGGYVDDQVVKRPTALHLYLYLLGVYYLGLTPEQVINGDEIIKGHDGGVGVTDMNGGQPYDDSSLALNITGSATSMYMQQFWGHDENLMYYRNHVYPLMSAG